MILSIALYCIIQIKAHELTAPARRVHDDASLKVIGEIDIMWLIRLFSESRFVAEGLPDKAFSATDLAHSGHPANFAKFRASGYWAGKPGGVNAITVDMTTSYLVTGVATKGISSKEFVTHYEVDTSEDGEDWRSQGHFVANFDGATICKVRFARPVLARFVKFTVVKYKHYPSMKVDVLVYELDHKY